MLVTVTDIMVIMEVMEVIGVLLFTIPTTIIIHIIVVFTIHSDIIEDTITHMDMNITEDTDITVMVMVMVMVMDIIIPIIQAIIMAILIMAILIIEMQIMVKEQRQVIDPTDTHRQILLSVTAIRRIEQ